MNKNTKITIGAAVVVLIIVAIFVSVNSNNNGANDADLVQVQGQDNIVLETEGEEVAEEVVNTELIPAPAAAPTVEEIKQMFAGVEFKIEFMTDEEKESMGIDKSSRVQVLGRNAEGQILGYKLIFSDEDIAQSLDDGLR